MAPIQNCLSRTYQSAQTLLPRNPDQKRLFVQAVALVPVVALSGILVANGIGFNPSLSFSYSMSSLLMLTGYVAVKKSSVLANFMFGNSKPPVTQTTQTVNTPVLQAPTSRATQDAREPLSHTPPKFTKDDTLQRDLDRAAIIPKNAKILSKRLDKELTILANATPTKESRRNFYEEGEALGRNYSKFILKFASLFSKEGLQKETDKLRGVLRLNSTCMLGDSSFNSKKLAETQAKLRTFLYANKKDPINKSAVSALSDFKNLNQEIITLASGKKTKEIIATAKDLILRLESFGENHINILTTEQQGKYHALLGLLTALTLEYPKS